MICTADRMKHVLYVSRELNIYYISEITKIWAETHSSLNIWSWIERVCLNDKNNEFATMINKNWFCRWVSHSIASLLEQHSKWVCYNDIRTWFSNKSLTCTFYNLSLFTTLMTTAKMICTANKVAYTICLERIEHILYVWKQKDMSWNSFIVEYLKLNRKSLLEWQE